MEDLTGKLEVFFQKKINVREINPMIYAISYPMYKIDGGMYDIYLLAKKDGFYLSDEGATMTELDKIFELGEPDVIKNLVAILKQFNCCRQGNSIVIQCTPQDIHIKLSHLVQAMSFMLNMKIFYV